ncbi:MAG: hypothetical protein AAF702_45690 [Chloroflexota bacterium]
MTLIFGLCIIVALFYVVVALWTENARLRDQSTRDAVTITTMSRANSLLEKQVIHLQAEKERHSPYYVTIGTN